MDDVAIGGGGGDGSGGNYNNDHIVVGKNDPPAPVLLLRDGGTGPPVDVTLLQPQPQPQRQRRSGEHVTTAEASGSSSRSLVPPTEAKQPLRTGRRPRRGDGDTNHGEDDDDEDDDEDNDVDENTRPIREGGNIKRPRTDETAQWTNEAEDYLMYEYMTRKDLKGGILTADEWEEISKEISNKFQIETTVDACKELAFHLTTEQMKHERQQKEHERQQKEHFKGVIEIRSYETLLSVSADQFHLVGQGSSRSATDGTHAEASATETEFRLPSFRDNYSWKRIKEIDAPSFLLSTFVDRKTKKLKQVTYTKEADIASLVRCAVQDAIVLYEELNPGHSTNLKIRLERNLFSLRPDLLVVVDQDSPVFAVEVKKPLAKSKRKSAKRKRKLARSKNNLAGAGNVLGQAFDYAQLMVANGLSNPYIVISTFEESLLCCLRHSKLNDELSMVNDLSGDPSQANDSPDAAAIKDDESPTPPKLDRYQGQIHSFRSHFSTVDAQRKLLRTKAYRSHELVSLLYAGLSKAMQENCRDGKQSLERIVELEMGHTYEFPKVLRIQLTKGYSWTKFRVTIGKEVDIKQKSRNKVFARFTNIPQPVRTEYFIIGNLGYGSTSNVYHAIDSNGSVVAMKVYVKPVDDEWELDKETFEAQATSKLETERDFLLQLYGDLLKDKVHVITLFSNLQCLVMPFFEPIQKDDRKARLKDIQTVLQTRFMEKNLMYADNDIRWRHVGIYRNGGTEHVILYDLADLQPLGGEIDMVERHCGILKRKCGHSSTPISTIFVGSEVS